VAFGGMGGKIDPFPRRKKERIDPLNQIALRSEGPPNLPPEEKKKRKKKNESFIERKGKGGKGSRPR